MEEGEKMPFLPPGEYLRGLYVGYETGILGGQERKGRGLWGRGEKIHHQLGPNGV